jgi:general stress protein 26
MALVHDDDHIEVSIYPFSDEEVDLMMSASQECVLMWATKDGWPVGVTHSFVWAEGKIWVTFAAHRHRAHAIRRDNRVSVSVTSSTYRPDASDELPIGGITFKGHGEFIEDEAKKQWMYQSLAARVNPDSPELQTGFEALLKKSPLRTVLAVTPVKKIMYNGTLSARHMAGTIDESELGERLTSDALLLKREIDRRGLRGR